MSKIPQPLWAVVLAAMGVIVALVAYCVPGDLTSKQAAFTVANSLISGALGAFAGHVAGQNINQSGPNATAVSPTPPPQP